MSLSLSLCTVFVSQSCTTAWTYTCTFPVFFFPLHYSLSLSFFLFLSPTPTPTHPPTHPHPPTPALTRTHYTPPPPSHTQSSSFLATLLQCLPHLHTNAPATLRLLQPLTHTPHGHTLLAAAVQECAQQWKAGGGVEGAPHTKLEGGNSGGGAQGVQEAFVVVCNMLRTQGVGGCPWVGGYFPLPTPPHTPCISPFSHS